MIFTIVWICWTLGFSPLSIMLSPGPEELNTMARAYNFPIMLSAHDSNIYWNNRFKSGGRWLLAMRERQKPLNWTLMQHPDNRMFQILTYVCFPFVKKIPKMPIIWSFFICLCMDKSQAIAHKQSNHPATHKWNTNCILMMCGFLCTFFW